MSLSICNFWCRLPRPVLPSSRQKFPPKRCIKERGVYLLPSPVCVYSNRRGYQFLAKIFNAFRGKALLLKRLSCYDGFLVNGNFRLFIFCNQLWIWAQSPKRLNRSTTRTNNRRKIKLWLWTARWRHFRTLDKHFAKLVKEVNFFINDGYLKFTYVKQDDEINFLHRSQLNYFDPYYHFCRLDSSILGSEMKTSNNSCNTAPWKPLLKRPINCVHHGTSITHFVVLLTNVFFEQFIRDLICRLVNLSWKSILLCTHMMSWHAHITLFSASDVL